MTSRQLFRVKDGDDFRDLRVEISGEVEAKDVERILAESLGKVSVEIVHSTTTSGEKDGEGDSDSGSQIKWFNRARSPETGYRGRKFESPRKPAPKKKQPFPLPAVIMPAIMGLVLYFVTKSPLTLLFVAMSPLMAVGNFIFGGRQNKADFKRESMEYEEKLVRLEKDKEAELEAERDWRHQQFAVDVNNPATLWNRHLEDKVFGELAVGVGDIQSSISVDGLTLELEHTEMTANLEENLGVVGEGAFQGILRDLLYSRAPSELKVSVFSGKSLWGESSLDYLKWSGHLLFGENNSAVANNPESELRLLETLEEVCENNLEFRLLVVVQAVEAKNRGRLEKLLMNEGVWGLWLGESLAALPYCCRYRLVENKLIDTSSGLETPLRSVISSTPEENLKLQLELLNVRDLSERHLDAQTIPTIVYLKDILNMDSLDQELTKEWVLLHWQQQLPGLRGYIGCSLLGPQLLDLEKDGPHALVGGTTGAGKSELLLGWMLSLALNHSPEDLNFLVVDYKGGSAFQSVRALPHIVGEVTDLDESLIERVMVSLRAELKRREVLLNSLEARDLNDYNSRLKRGIAEFTPREVCDNGSEKPSRLPKLLIVVDEFAALKAELPEFVDGLVDIAARGRSLGIHLILATQRPAGAISGSLRTNTNLRISLRQADEADSNDVLGTKEAAAIPASLKGRAFFRIGSGATTEFQSTYISASGNSLSKVEVYDFYLLPGSYTGRKLLSREFMPTRGSKAAGSAKSITDGELAVKIIVEAFTASGLRTPRKPWLEALPERIELTADEFARGVFGLQDIPEKQRQTPLILDPEGNVLVIGSQRSGKTTALRTLAHCVRSSIIWIDGARATESTEEVERLWRKLRRCVEGRGDLKRERVALIIDGLDLLREALEPSKFSVLSGMLTELLRKSSHFGCQILASASRVNAIPSSFSSCFQSRLILRLANSNELMLSGVQVEQIGKNPEAGRGVLQKDGEMVLVQVGVTSEDTEGELETVEPLIASEVSVDLANTGEGLLTVLDFETLSPVTPGNTAVVIAKKPQNLKLPDNFSGKIVDFADISNTFQTAGELKNEPQLLFIGPDENECYSLFKAEYPRLPFIQRDGSFGYLVTDGAAQMVRAVVAE